MLTYKKLRGEGGEIRKNPKTESILACAFYNANFLVREILVGMISSLESRWPK